LHFLYLFDKMLFKIDNDITLVIGKQHSITSTASNMGFSAMLADEYILIVPFAYHLQSRLN
jgi:hypothetical protein